MALIDRAGVGEQTSYGNSGVIEGSTILPPAFPSSFNALMRVAFKRASEANYHLTFLPKVAPWLLAFRAASKPESIVETARLNRPLFAHALAEHETLMAEAGATRYLRKTGWLKLYRSARAFAALAREFDLAREFGLPLEVLDAQGTQALEPSLNPVFSNAVFWPKAASLSDPLAVTRAYAARFRALGGVTLNGDARSLHRAGRGWRVETNEGGVDAPEVVVALGPWAPDLLEPLGLKLPMAVKRGYHRHFRTPGQCGAVAAGGRYSQRLFDNADEAGHPPHHRRRIRRARRSPHAGAIRQADAEGARTVSAWRTRRRQDVARQPAVFPGFAAGDRPRAQLARPVAGDRACALGSHAWPRHWPSNCRHDDGRFAVLRSGAVRGRALQCAGVSSLKS